MCIGKNPLLSKYGLVEETSLYFKLKRLGTQLLLNDESSIRNLKKNHFSVSLLSYGLKIGGI